MIPSFLSTYFLIHYYIKRDLKKIINKYHIKNSLLDVGCGQKPLRNFFVNSTVYHGIDFKNYSTTKDFPKSKPDYYFSNGYKQTLNLPFADNSYHNCVCFQVLEHHPNPQKLISELIRVTKREGYILITAPFLYPLHEIPNDYQRITIYGYTELFKLHKNVHICEILEQGSFFSVLAMFFSEILNKFAAKNIFCYLTSVIFLLPLLVYQYLALFLDKYFATPSFCLNYLLVIQKNKR